MVSDEQWDKLYESITTSVYYELEIYFKDHPAKHTILSEVIGTILSNVLEVLEEDARRSS